MPKASIDKGHVKVIRQRRYGSSERVRRKKAAKNKNCIWTKQHERARWQRMNCMNASCASIMLTIAVCFSGCLGRIACRSSCLFVGFGMYCAFFVKALSKDRGQCHKYTCPLGYSVDECQVINENQPQHFTPPTSKKDKRPYNQRKI